MWNRIKNIFKPKVEPMNKIYIHAKNILHNYNYLWSLQSWAAMFPVLKSNAYGHWLELVTKILNKTDAPYLVVDSFPEYQIVKKYSNKNILLLWETLKRNYRKFNYSRTTFCVYNMETISYLAKKNKHIKIHLFLDTGMHREWLTEDDLVNVLEFLRDYPKIEIEWVLSHFYDADKSWKNWMEDQIEQFKKMYHTIVDYWYTPKWKHIWSSAWILKMKDKFFNAYRPGLYLYWYNNLSHDDEAFELTRRLRPALSVYSRIISLREIQDWDGVSYNKTWKTNWKTLVATVPFGYFEWLPKSASNKIVFKYEKQYVRQVWNICMNLCCAKIDKWELFDQIEIIWLWGQDSIMELAKASWKSPYEILVWFDRNIRREIV